MDNPVSPVEAPGDVGDGEQSDVISLGPDEVGQEDAEGVDNVGDEDVSEEAEIPRLMRDPGQPTA